MCGDSVYLREKIKLHRRSSKCASFILQSNRTRNCNFRTIHTTFTEIFFSPFFGMRIFSFFSAWHLLVICIVGALNLFKQSKVVYFKCVKLLVIKKLSHAFEGLSLSSFHLQNKIFQTPAKRFGHSTRLVLFKHLNEKITFGTVILYYVPMTRQINIEDDLTQ